MLDRYSGTYLMTLELLRQSPVGRSCVWIYTFDDFIIPAMNPNWFLVFILVPMAKCSKTILITSR